MIESLAAPTLREPQRAVRPLDLERLEIRKHLRGGRTMDHRWNFRCISCDGRTALEPLAFLYRRHTLEEAG